MGRRKGAGRPATYDTAGDGAPRLTVRLDPAILHRVKHHPEGPRNYISRLVLNDVALEAAAETRERRPGEAGSSGGD